MNITQKIQQSRNKVISKKKNSTIKEIKNMHKISPQSYLNRYTINANKINIISNTNDHNENINNTF